MGGGPQPLTFAGWEIRERELRRIRIDEAPVKRNMHRTQRGNIITIICGKAAVTSLREVRRGISSLIQLTFSDAELDELLADCDRCASGQSFARYRRVRAYRMAALSAAVGGHLPARRRSA